MCWEEMGLQYDIGVGIAARGLQWCFCYHYRYYGENEGLGWDIEAIPLASERISYVSPLIFQLIFPVDDCLISVHCVLVAQHNLYEVLRCWHSRPIGFTLRVVIGFDY